MGLGNDWCPDAPASYGPGASRPVRVCETRAVRDGSNSIATHGDARIARQLAEKSDTKICVTSVFHRISAPEEIFSPLGGCILVDFRCVQVTGRHLGSFTEQFID